MRGTVIPVEISIYEDRTFTFILKTPPTPVLLRQAAGVAKGAHLAGRETVGDGDDGPGRRDRQDQTEGPQHRRPRDGQAARWPARRARWASRSRARRDMKHGKNYRNALAQVDREELLTRPRGDRQGEDPRDARSSTRPSSSPMRLGRRPAQGRADRARHDLAARGHRQDQPRRRLRRRRGGPGRARRRRGRRRRRGPGRQGRRRIPRLRRRDRDARTSWARSVGSVACSVRAV